MRRHDADPTRVDWFGVLLELQRAGLKTWRVAEGLGIPKATVYGWKQGNEPRYVDGERLVRLWMQIVGRERSDLPRLAK